METIDQIHQDLKALNLPTIELKGVKRLIERSFRAGLTRNIEQAAPLDGYSNLTAAISAGEPIDWERLEGLSAKCVHPELPSPLPIGSLQVHDDSALSTPTGWRETIESFGAVRRRALAYSWWGDYDWTLYIEGDVPLRRKTADQLPLGTCFEGEYHGSRIELAQVIANRYGKRLVTDHLEKNIGGYAEEEVEVIEEYGIGTFHKPEGK